MNLYLFDLDETLVSLADIHKKGYENMMKSVYGYSGKFEDGKGPGRNAHTIIYDMLAHMSKEDVDAKNKEALAFLAKNLNENVNADHIFPNIKALLFALTRAPHKVALYTGGSREVTDAILEKTGLKGFLEFSVCAEPGEERTDFLGRAIEEAKSRHGNFEKIFVVGDTYHDVRAAKAHNAIAVAVGTGVQPREEVLAAKPDVFFENLQDIDNVLEEIG
jgi:phosphoglycolate phosphatase